MILIALIFSILNLQPIEADNLTQVQQLSEIAIIGGVNGIDFHPTDPTNLAIAQESGEISTWNVSNTETLLNQWTVSEKPIIALEYTSNGQIIISISMTGIQISDATSGLLIKEIPHPLSAIPTVLSVADDTTVGVGYMDGKVRLFNIDSEKLVQTLFGYEVEVYTIDFSENGEYLAYGYPFGKIFIWKLSDTQNGDIYLKQIFDTQELNELSFNPVVAEPLLIETLASISNFISIQTWDILSMSQGVENMTYQMAYPDHLSFSPNGYLVAIVGKETTAGGGCNTNLCPIEIVNLQKYSSEAGFEAIQIGSHDMWYADVDFNSDGRLLASASKDGQIKIWGILSE